MSNASGNTVVHVPWYKWKTHLHCTTLLPECSPFDGFASGNSWSQSWSTLSWRKKGQQCDQQSPSGDDSRLPQLQPKLQNQGPLNLSCLTPPPCLHLWSCCGPDPSHHFLFAGHPTHSDFGLVSALWPPFQSLSSFAGWLGLGLDPALFSVPWTQPTHLRWKVLNSGSLLQGEAFWSIFSPPSRKSIGFREWPPQGRWKVEGRECRHLGAEEVNDICSRNGDASAHGCRSISQWQSHREKRMCVSAAKGLR